MAAATIELSETNGTRPLSATTNGISNINFGMIDAPNLVPANTPIVIDTFLSRYSRMKSIRFHVISMGTSTTVGYLKLWKSSGAYVTGETIGTNFNSQAAGRIPMEYGRTIPAAGGGIITPFPYAGSGNTTVGNEWNIVAIPVSQTTTNFVSISGSFTTSITADGYSDFCYLSTMIAAASPAGAANQKVITFQYDES